MPSSSPLNGTAVVLKINGTTVANLKSNTMSFTRALIDVSNKDSGGWKESIYGQGSATFDFEGVFVENGNWGFSQAFVALNSKSTFTARWSGPAGDIYYQATCLISSLSETAPMEDAVTFSGTLEMTGAPTTGTV
jgi:predicted secreted protein